MRYRQSLLTSLALAGLLTIVTSCGKKSDTESETATTSGSDATQTAKKGDELTNIAKMAMASADIEEEGAEFRKVIEGAGYTAASYDVFPAQELGKKGRILIYKNDDKSGGIIYMKKVGSLVSPTWHWHFDDRVPEKVTKVELNGDGLWDLRVDCSDGKTMDFIQDETFTLVANERNDWIAMNGEASPPASADDAPWKCFDGDPATAWRSPMSGGKVFMELPAPFGVEQGLLTVTTLPSEQPHHCAVLVDGKEVKEFDLEAKAAEQTVQLGSGVQGAKSVKLVINSAYGNDGVVAIAELALR